jgi:iron complex outermembrane receptor protein
MNLFVISGILVAMGIRGLAQTAGITGSTTDTSGRPLKEVVVNGARPYITQTADKITINVAQSLLTAGSNAWDVILRAPGITEQNGQLNYTGKSIIVLINGRPAALSGEELKNMLTNMPANGIDKVELLPTAK